MISQALRDKVSLEGAEMPLEQLAELLTAERQIPALLDKGCAAGRGLGLESPTLLRPATICPWRPRDRPRRNPWA